MSVSTLYLPRDWKIEITVDHVEITSLLPSPDPNWKYTDAAGHEHHRAAMLSGVYIVDGYPTLRWVEDEPAGFDMDGEEYPAQGHHECSLCGEHIVPGTRPSTFREFVPGPMDIMVFPPNHQPPFPITREQLDSIWSSEGWEAVGVAQALLDDQLKRGEASGE